ncbi:hypothetical protein FACS189491_08910 [Spirochaetia bacterium]|nr:hypothetical protein FACS189491_08910 [Spirochaetia bacterium]
MNISLSGKKPFILTLLKGAAFFSFGTCLLSVFLYAAGTRQEFMDSAQLRLIHGAMTSGILSAFMSLYGIITDIVYLVRRHCDRQYVPRCSVYIWSIAGYLFLGLAGSFIAVLGALITAAAGGNVS